MSECRICGREIGMPKKSKCPASASTVFHTITINGRCQSVQPIKARIFSMLCDAYPRPAVKESLFMQVWDGQEPEDAEAALKSHISQLRKRVLKGTDCRIEAVHGVGYELQFSDGA